MIVTANRAFEGTRYSTWDAWLRVVVLPAARRAGVDRILPATGEHVALAEVNHGRWVVYCHCGGAEMAWDEGLVMCMGCFNSHARHELVRTHFPANRVEIDAVLDRRPLVNRNWRRGETLEQLMRENAEHPLEVMS